MSVVQGSRDATALVGISELVVGVQELVAGEWWLYVETPQEFTGCSSCGTRAVGHGRATTVVRDLPIAGADGVGVRSSPVALPRTVVPGDDVVRTR